MTTDKKIKRVEKKGTELRRESSRFTFPFPVTRLPPSLPHRHTAGRVKVGEGNQGEEGERKRRTERRRGWRERGREGRGTILIRAHLNADPSRSPTTLAFIIPRYHSVRRWLGTSGGASRSRGGRPGGWGRQVTLPLSCIVHRHQVSLAPGAVSRCMMPPGHCSLGQRHGTLRGPASGVSGLSCGLSRRSRGHYVEGI